MDCIDIHCPCEIPEHCPQDPDDVAYYTQIIVNGELTIPDIKPPAEKIIDSTRKICITKIVPITVKLGKGKDTGCKVLVAGTIRLGFEYSADIPEQEVHFVHFDIPFQGLILGGPCHEPIPLRDCDLSKFNIHVCVEHLQIDQINSRTVGKVLVLLVWLERNEENDECKGKKCTGDIDEECLPFPQNAIPDISKEIAINNKLIIPPQKPTVECILKSSYKIKITKAEVIDTPLVEKSCHNPIQKVVITGKVEITIKYVADVPDQQVHAAIFKLPFEALIEWTDGPPASTPICVYPVEEHFQVDFTDPRHFFATLIIRLDVFKIK